MHVTTQNTPTNRRYNRRLVLHPQDFSQIVRFGNRTISCDYSLTELLLEGIISGLEILILVANNQSLKEV